MIQDTKDQPSIDSGLDSMDHVIASEDRDYDTSHLPEEAQKEWDGLQKMASQAKHNGVTSARGIDVVAELNRQYPPVGYHTRILVTSLLYNIKFVFVV